MVRKGRLSQGFGSVIMRSRRKKPGWQLRIARIRIQEMLDLAREVTEKDESLARRYVEHAIRVAEKFNIRFSKEEKLRFCRKCNTCFVTSKNALYRANPETKALEVRCLRCGYVRGLDTDEDYHSRKG